MLASLLISSVLLWRLWRSSEYIVLKLIISLVTLVPYLGPLFYFFVTDRTPPKNPEDEVHGKGDYTIAWINKRERMLREMKEKQ